MGKKGGCYRGIIMEDGKMTLFRMNDEGASLVWIVRRIVSYNFLGSILRVDGKGQSLWGMVRE